MADHSLVLPDRQAKPRTRGLTMVIDNGMPAGLFEDVLDSYHEYVDLVKFGWGTSVVTRSIKRKTAALNEREVPFLLGGTLFEKHVQQGRFNEFRALCHNLGCRYVEVSNGTIDLEPAAKAELIGVLAGEFEVLAEVGFKDQPRSELLSPSQWIENINSDLLAGAKYVVLESRESGSSGICRPDGELRYGLVEDILRSGVDVNRLLFEAPTKSIQTYFVKRVGPEVNLGNIAALDVLALETLRLGLRADTLLDPMETGDENIP
ncbi:phosphosulfolactate synthase [Streptomyces sp. NPDC059989]|uniref:phosphosulfolactate synthase n=1 Tax=Streptomyces sp. NPDC059989 TaxID=3347026 RepID=UPI0036AE37E6